MASAVMAAKLKCGSTFASITSTSLDRPPARSSLSLAMSSTTSRVTVFTRASGATSWANDEPRKIDRSSVATNFFMTSLQFLPRRPAIVDEAAAPLQVGVALEHVLVERRLLEDAARLEQVRAQVGGARHDKRIAQVDRADLPHRIRIHVDPGPQAVAQRARAQQRQDEIGSGPGAPAAEGLAEILVMFLVAPLGGDVVDAEQAERAVKRKARPVVDAVGELALQKIVHPDQRVGEVGEEVADAHADLLVQHLDISARHRPRQPVVEGLVEAVHAAVHALPG